MYKVIKIIISVISSLILAAIILPVMLTLLLMLEPVQNYAARKAAAWASGKLETTVSIERIRLKLFSKVSIDGFYVEDHRGDTLLHAGKVDGTISGAGLLRGSINLGDVSLSDVDFNLAEDITGIMNIRPVVEKLKRKVPRKHITRISANSLSIDNLRFTMRKYDSSGMGPGVDFGDLDLRGFNLRGSNIRIIDDSVTMRLGNISFTEKSGFSLETFSSENVAVSSRVVRLSRPRIAAGKTDLRFDRIQMNYDSWNAFTDFTEKVDLLAVIDNLAVSLGTVGWFVPSLYGVPTGILLRDGMIRGTVSSVSGSITAYTGFGTVVPLKFRSTGLPDITSARFDVETEGIVTSYQDIENIVTEITGNEPVRTPALQKLANLGEVRLAGKFNGTLSRFTADAVLSSGSGNLAFDLAFTPSADQLSTGFGGNVRIDRFRLDRMMDNDKFGGVSFTANVDGSYARENLKAEITALLSDFDFNGYAYSDISFDGLIENNTFTGLIASDDPNIDFDFNGLLDFNDSIPHYDFELQLNNADLFALNFNSRDSISRLSMDLIATASGNKADNLNGRVDIHHLSYINHLDSVETGLIKLVGDNNDRSKFLGLYSDFADLEFRSRAPYSRLADYFKNTLASYLPTLGEPEPAAQSLSNGTSVSAADASNYSLLTLNVKEANNVAGIFVPGLILASGTRATLMFNPYIENFSLAVHSDWIERNRSFIENLEITSRNEGDSISLYLRADDVYFLGLRMPEFLVIAGARDNRISVAARFEDKNTDNSALIGAGVNLGRDTVTGIPYATLRLTPSYIRDGGRIWNIYGWDIRMDSTALDVGNFYVQGDDQVMRLYGRMGASQTDTLHLNMTNFDIGPLLQIAQERGYFIEGRASGHVDLIAARSEPNLHAELKFDSVNVNGLQAPPASFESIWDLANQRASVRLVNEAAGQTVMTGYYTPDGHRYRVDVDLRTIDLSLLEPLFDGVMTDSHGYADVTARVTGEGRMLRVNGKADVPEFETTIEVLNVPYRMDGASATVVDNRLTVSGATVTDPEGNTARMDVDVNLNNLQNVTYDIHIQPENMLVLNTNHELNDLFYGRVFASGDARVRGDNLGVNMDITATTTAASDFYMPLGGATEAGTFGNISFVRPRPERVDSTGYTGRKVELLTRTRRGRRLREDARMDISMIVNVTPTLNFQLMLDPQVGSSIRAVGNGSLRMNIQPRNDIFTMSGDYEITDGTYLLSLQNILTRRFAIEQGSSIRWTGDPLDAMLDITGVYRLKASLSPLQTELGLTEAYSPRIPVDCYIMLTDRLSQPTITFDIMLPNNSEFEGRLVNALGTQEAKATQFFFLLATNSFLSTNSTIQGNIGAVGSSSTAFAILTNQISEWISTDRFNVGFGFSPRSDDTTADEFNIDFSTELIDNRLILELEGNYASGNNVKLNNNSANNLTGDFYLTWMLDRAGSLRIKGFTRTIDRYDENQGLQESGLGIYYREDFNNFLDIVRNSKDRFRSRQQRKRDEQESQQDLEREEEAVQQEIEMQLQRRMELERSVRRDSPQDSTGRRFQGRGYRPRGTVERPVREFRNDILVPRQESMPNGNRTAPPFPGQETVPKSGDGIARREKDDALEQFIRDGEDAAYDGSKVVKND